MSSYVAATLHGAIPVRVPEVDAGHRVLNDADLQLALWTLYGLHYRGYEEVEPGWEWDPGLIGLRVRLEQLLERDVRRACEGTLATVPDQVDVAEQVFTMAAGDDGPSVAAFLHRKATREQVVEFLRVRSVYHLKESDPQAFVLPRLDGVAKTALAELLHDEFGGGRPERLHATMFGDALAACGLDRRFGAYVDDASALTLALDNVMSMFALNRRLRGAAMGHLAMFEATSSVPCRKIAAGIERVGLPDVVAAYYHEHVEADAVHEQVAVRDICGGLVAAEPYLRDDVLLGAASCQVMDALAGQELLRGWQAEVAA